MRQVKSKFWNIKRLAFLGVVLSMVLAGCRDNPEDEAAKAVHEKIEKALALSDRADAEQQVQMAIAQYRPTGLTGDSAYLVSGYLVFERALSLGADLDKKMLPVRKSIDAIASGLTSAQRWMLEQERIDTMLTLRDREIAEFKLLISGTSEQPGLEARLAEARAVQGKLLEQKQLVQEEKNKIQAVLDDYQVRSEELLKKADLAKGDEQLNLRKEAYDLQLKRKDDYVRSQAAENQIGNLDGDIALVTSRVELLEEDLQKTQAKIAALETAAARELLKSQRAELEGLLSDQQKNIYASADAIKAGLDSYRQSVEEICGLLEKAAESYERVRSDNARFSAVVRQADSYTYAAKVYAEQMAFSRNVATRLTGILDAADSSLTQGLAERLPLNATLDPERLKKIIELFDLADQAYEDAFMRANRIADRGDAAARSVLGSHVLAMRSKMQWADALAQYDAAKQAQDRLEALKTQGQEQFGSSFTLSESARLLDKGLDFVPSMPVNVELYFEGIRNQFAEWKQLPTPEQQAEAVAINLAAMESLEKAYGDEMVRLLAPIKQEMLAAKERGFAAPAAAPVGAGPSEPNNL